ncbi:MAG TPA: gamma-glutamyltransferase [Gaiella sp.]|jgi:gamma-glutamyltranspeptidase/glutathione hydrolase
MRGAIAAGHPGTAAVGAGVLADGGNAVDAAVAAVLAAFVAEGPLTGPAGGGFLLVREPGTPPVVLDCFFAVPARARGEMVELVIDFADASTQVFHIGEESVAVPGLLAGLEEAHRRFGSWAWADLVEPALVLARAGVEVNDAQAFLHEILVPILQRDEGGRRIYAGGARLVTEDLVPALELIRGDGAGALAVLLPELAADLAGYAVLERTPLRGTLFGHEILTTPEPSMGGAVVQAALAALDGSRDPAALPGAIGRSYAGVAATTRVTGTTHVAVLDAGGTVASFSSTLGSGSGVFRHGFQLNNMLGELDVIGREPRPAGSRLPSMMTPTLCLAEGEPRLVLGSAGSVRLAGAIAQVAWRVIARGEPVEEAIAAPRVHVDDGLLHLEGGWDEPVASELDVLRWSGSNLFFGGVSAVERRPGGELAAAGDPRRGGHGIVVP